MNDGKKEFGPNTDIFTDWISKNYGGNSRTKTITYEKYLRICKLLQGEVTNSNAKFRFWVRNKGFRLIRYDESDDSIKDDPNGELYVSLHAREESNGDNIETFLRKKLPAISFFRKVAIVEEFYGIIKKAHVDLKGHHAGQKKTYRLVSDTYAFLPREAITFYLLNCELCKPRIQKYGPTMKEKAQEKIRKQSIQRVDEELYFSFDEAKSESCIQDTKSKPSTIHHTSAPVYINGDSNDKYFESKNINVMSSNKGIYYRRTTERQISPGPPSLCYVPKNNNNSLTEQFFENGRNDSKNLSLPLLKKMKNEFYNNEQLQDIEKYIQERKKIDDEGKMANFREKEWDKDTYFDHNDIKMDQVKHIERGLYKNSPIYKRSKEALLQCIDETSDDARDIVYFSNDKNLHSLRKLGMKGYFPVTPDLLAKNEIFKNIRSEDFQHFPRKDTMVIRPLEKLFDYRKRGLRSEGSISSESPESAEFETLTENEQYTNIDSDHLRYNQFSDFPTPDTFKLISPVHTADFQINHMNPIQPPNTKVRITDQAKISKYISPFHEVHL